MQVVVRRQVERLFPGLPWHQGVAVLTTVWMVLVAAMAIVLAAVGDERALAGRQVVVPMPAPGKASSAPPPLLATPSQSTGASDTSPDDAGTDNASAAAAAPLEESLAPAPAPELLPSLEPEPTDPGDAGDQPEATTWKAGAEAYTVAIESFAKEAEALTAADVALAAGIEAGSVASDGFASLRDGIFVVFSGYHATLSEAGKAADDLAGRGYTKAQPVYLSEKRVRRCEDGEQPRPTVPEDAKKPAAGAGGATPRAAGGDTATTGGGSDTATTGGVGDQNEQLASLEVPCEVRPADKATGQDGSSDDAGGGPAVKP